MVDFLTCRCGKRGWSTKAAAKKVRRVTDRGMATCQCALSALWHNGHLPQAVSNGRLSRAQLSSPDRRIRDAERLDGAA